MKTVTMGGIEISAMTLGTVQLGMKYGVNNQSGMPSREESFEILKAAWDGGVTMLDTSNDYGESEKVIGGYLAENPANKFAICTKFRIDDESAKDVYGSLRAFALESAKKLGIEQIPIFMSHIEDDYLNHGEKLAAALAELKKEGIIKQAGMSMSRKTELGRIIDSGVFDAIQIPMNIWDNKEIINGTVKKMKDNGIAVFVRSVYLQGMFFKTVDMVKDTKFADAAPLLEKLAEIAADEGVTVPQLALTFIRDTDGVSSLVVGSETAAQVRENVKAFNTPEMSAKTRERIMTEFANVDPFLISPWTWNSRK